MKTLKKWWLRHPNVDLLLSIVCGCAFTLYRHWRPDYDVNALAGVLAQVAGTMLSLFSIVLALLHEHGGARVKEVLDANAREANANWRSVLSLTSIALGLALFVAGFSDRHSLLNAACLGFAMAALGTSALRMGWFASLSFALAEKPEVLQKKARLRDDL